MISSEVQRTLVKSPPELWAEISDPTSLARHLGEFGEIHITRVEPEQRVEWEADDASGSVVIKPSGWGTKVKLTVTRELPDGVVQVLDDAGSGSLEDAGADEDEAAGEAIVEMLEAAPREAERPPELPSAQLRQDFAPGTRIAPEQLPQDDEHDYDGDQDESDGRAAGESPLSLEDELLEGLDAREPDEEPDAEPAPQPRRGFLARWFARRRPQAAVAVAPPDQPMPARPTTDDQAHAPAPRYNALAAWASQAADEDERGAAASLAGADLTPCGAPSEELGEDPSDALEREPTAGADAAAGTSAPPDTSGAPENDGARPEVAAADDLSAELQAAEEVAVEQVTAVLSGVLDRLGAAHHRPFSRA